MEKNPACNFISADKKQNKTKKIAAGKNMNSYIPAFSKRLLGGQLGGGGRINDYYNLKSHEKSYSLFMIHNDT